MQIFFLLLVPIVLHLYYGKSFVGCEVIRIMLQWCAIGGKNESVYLF